MNAETRWMIGGVMGAITALGGWIVFAQASTDVRQDDRISEVHAQSVESDKRQDDVLAEISKAQADTAAGQQQCIFNRTRIFQADRAGSTRHPDSGHHFGCGPGQGDGHQVR